MKFHQLPLLKTIQLNSENWLSSPGVIGTIVLIFIIIFLGVFIFLKRLNRYVDFLEKNTTDLTEEEFQRRLINLEEEDVDNILELRQQGFKTNVKPSNIAETSSKYIGIYVLLLFVFIISCKGENSKSHLHSNHSSRGWSYTGETAPKFWAQLVEDSDCGEKHQSPINIISKNAKKQTISKFKKYYSASTILTKVIYNGHSIEFDFKQGDSIVVGETNTFHLSQIHFHEPAEHKINGIIFPIEIHLVHKNKNNNYAVMSIFGMEGDESQLFEFLESFLPLKSGDSKSINTSVDLASIFPEDESYFIYKGSLTTPPCTEEVQWIVFTEPIILSLNEVKVLKENMPLNNFREEQPINGRVIYFFEDK